MKPTPPVTLTSIFPCRPVPEWQHVIRRQLRNFVTSVLDDSQISRLHITIQEEDGLFARSTLNTLAQIESFRTTDKYQAAIHFLPVGYRNQPTWAKAHSAIVASRLSSWAEDLGGEYSENRTVFRRKEHRLRITGDSYTKGVKSIMTVHDFMAHNSLSVIVRRRRRHESQLNSTELYTLLTMADEQRKACPSVSIYKVHAIIVNTYWVHRLSADISPSYISSIIDGNNKIIGSIEVRRSPWFNFYEEPGRQLVLQAVFEHFPLSLTSTRPPIICSPQKRTNVPPPDALSKRRKK